MGTKGRIKENAGAGIRTSDGEGKEGHSLVLLWGTDLKGDQ